MKILWAAIQIAYCLYLTSGHLCAAEKIRAANGGFGTSLGDRPHDQTPATRQGRLVDPIK